MDSSLLEILHISKSYGGVHALRDVSFTVKAGEIHALCGENGAGKSTVIKCLCGVTAPDQGVIRLAGHSLQLGNVQAAERAGIAVIHQESTAFPDLNTVANIFVGRELRRWGGTLLDHRRMAHKARSLLAHLGQSFDVYQPIRDLPIAHTQMVSLARALSHDCRLLILDEPTASLSERETDILLDIVSRLRDEGVAVLYVSHRLEEIFRLADRVTVLRDGQHVTTQPISQITRPQLIRQMVGEEVETLTRHHRHAGKVGSARLTVSGLSQDGLFHDISFTLHSHEIVGLAGLVGSGRSEIARAIFGMDPYQRGTVHVNGTLLPVGDIRAAMRSGVALVPEDRQHEGLILPMSVAENLSLGVLQRLSRCGLVSRSGELRLVRELTDALRIKTADVHLPADTLSGGNQQKLVLGKWLAQKPSVLLLDEPTRGVDVGAKAQVHQLIRQLAADGAATLVISSEFPELLALCDRILVLSEGHITAELDGARATHQQILQHALPANQPPQRVEIGG